MNPTRSRIPQKFSIGFFALSSLLLSGCSLPTIQPARTDTVRYYVLAGTAGLQFEAAGVHVRPVRVPAYLQSRLLAVRLAENEVRYAADAHWAEPLDAALTQLLRAKVKATAAGADEITVQVLVQQCEGAIGADNGVRFAATFEISTGAKNAATTRHEFTAAPRAWDGKNYADLAAGLRAAAGELADAISVALTEKK